MQITEDQIIISFTRQWLSSTTEWSIERFGTDLLAPALFKAGIDISPDKEIDPNDGAAFLRWKSTKGVQLSRIMTGSTKFPLSWKWPWVNSLPEPFQSKCRTELLSLAGVMNVPLPVVCIEERKPTRARLSEFMRESADVLAAGAAADDGVYDHNDDPEAANRLVNEMLDVIEVLNREIEAIATGTGCTGRLAAAVVIGSEKSDG